MGSSQIAGRLGLADWMPGTMSLPDSANRRHILERRRYDPIPCLSSRM